MTLDQSEFAPMSACRPINPYEIVLGVDGGGTKTSAWLARRESGPVVTPLGVGAAGPSNPRAVGFAIAQANISAAVAAAFQDARIVESCVGSACLGLAGAGRASEQQAMREWALKAGLATSVHVTHDAEITLAAGCPGGAGIALISGTGSLAWGRNASGQTARTGGWGYLLGDEGSGYAIALAGLRAVVRAADSRDAPTALQQSFLKHFNVATPTDLIEAVYDPQLTRRQLSDLASVVFAAATADETARSIIHNAAVDLAQLVETLASKLALASGKFHLACAGGVILHEPVLRERLLGRLRDQGITPGCFQLVANPVEGAVRLAMRR